MVPLRLSLAAEQRTPPTAPMMSVSTLSLLYLLLLSMFVTEFAFEIGSSLLVEVRRLQALLAERDKLIKDMQEEKDDLERAIESLRMSLREQEGTTGAFPLRHFFGAHSHPL